ncbi:MAG: plethodontid receptivity factor PRF [Candidatus Amulumruptor sp.]
MYRKLTCVAFVIMASLMLSTHISAETKVVEKSAKKAPEWLGTAADGYLIVTVEAPSRAEAQRRATAEITERIIHSVASNVTVEQSNIATETITNGEVSESSDTYSRQSSIRTANLPFIKGISLSKAADIYWAKLRDKKTGAEHYEYSVKYPYTRLEQQMLQSDFEELDRQKVAELENLEAQVDNITAMEQIGSGIARLDALGEYFFDKARAARVKGLRTQYNDLYKSLGVTGKIVKPGTIECALTVQGHPVSCGMSPVATSNCANNIQVSPEDVIFKVYYETADCLDDEDNYVDVTFRIKGKKVARHFVIKADDGDGAGNGKFSIVPCDRVVLTADSINAAKATIGAVNVTMTLDNRGDTDFGVKALHMSVPGLATPIDVDNIDAIYTSRGIVKVRCKVMGTLRVTSSHPSQTVTGTIDVVNPLTERVERLRFALPFTVNWD